MRYKLQTTITTYIESSASVEEARAEIFARYHQVSQDLGDEGVSRQADCILYDKIIATEVSHIFGEDDE